MTWMDETQLYWSKRWTWLRDEYLRRVYDTANCPDGPCGRCEVPERVAFQRLHEVYPFVIANDVPANMTSTQWLDSKPNTHDPSKSIARTVKRLLSRSVTSGQNGQEVQQRT